MLGKQAGEDVGEDVGKRIERVVIVGKMGGTQHAVEHTVTTKWGNNLVKKLMGI